MSKVSDRIEKQVLLRAPQARVWEAITESDQFGHWFGVKVDGPFRAGEKVRARVAQTRVDPEVAKMQEPYEGMEFEFIVERIEPMTLFSYRWHPGAADPADYPDEQTTLVEFVLEAAEGGTLLRITESGFDRVPAERRAEAFESNEHGWELQTQLITKYLAQAA